MNSDENVGISIMKIVEELDSGPVSNIYKLRLNPDDNAKDISEKLSKLAAEKILNNVDAILEDKAKFEEQDHSKATYAKKIEKIEDKINWNDKATNIIGKINGLFPNPCAFFFLKERDIKFLKLK